MTCSRERSAPLRAVFLVEHRRRERRRARPRLSCVSVNLHPPTRLAVLGGGAYRVRAKRNSYRNYCPLGGHPRDRRRGAAVRRRAAGSCSTCSRVPHARCSRPGPTRSPRSPSRRACCSTTSRPTPDRSCVAASTSSRSTPAARAAHRAVRCSTPPSALLGEPAVLYKEKINYKLPGGAGYSAHQDAPAYPLIAIARVGDGRDRRRRRRATAASRWSRAASTGCSPMDERGCVDRSVEDTLEWEPVTVPGRARRSGSTAGRRTAADRTARAARDGRCTRPTTPHVRATGAAEYYAAKAAAFATGDARRPRAGLADRRLRGTARMKVVFTVLDSLAGAPRGRPSTRRCSPRSRRRRA